MSFPAVVGQQKGPLHQDREACEGAKPASDGHLGEVGKRRGRWKEIRVDTSEDHARVGREHAEYHRRADTHHPAERGGGGAEEEQWAGQARSLRCRALTAGNTG